DEARPEDDVLDPRALDGLLHVPLGTVVRNGVLRPLADSKRAHQHEATDAFLLCGGDEVARSLRHDALEVRGTSGDDRDEMDDGVAAGDGAAQACRVGDVALDELDAE